MKIAEMSNEYVPTKSGRMDNIWCELSHSKSRKGALTEGHPNYT